MTDGPLSEIQNKFDQINQLISEAAQRSHRMPQDIHLVVVTKSQPPEKVSAVIRAGARILGENYPEETQEKIGLVVGARPGGVAHDWTPAESQSAYHCYTL